MKYKDGEWRIENKVFDTFQDYQLSTEEALALNAKSGAIAADPSLAFDETMSLRIKMAAAILIRNDIVSSNARLGSAAIAPDFAFNANASSVDN